MPRCKQCGSTYFSVFGVCPVCRQAEYEYKSETQNTASYTPDEQKRLMIKNWIEICVGVPALIGLVYGIIYIMGVLKG